MNVLDTYRYRFSIDTASMQLGMQNSTKKRGGEMNKEGGIQQHLGLHEYFQHFVLLFFVSLHFSSA